MVTRTLLSAGIGPDFVCSAHTSAFCRACRVLVGLLFLTCQRFPDGNSVALLSYVGGKEMKDLDEFACQ